MHSRFIPLTTGGVAQILNSTEPRVAETVRRGHVKPEPSVIAGRRIWTIDQVLQAAVALGLDPEDVRQRIDLGEDEGPDSSQEGGAA